MIVECGATSLDFFHARVRSHCSFHAQPLLVLQHRHKIDPQKSVDVENGAVVGKADQLSGGKYIGVPTIAELIHNGGGKTAIATAKTVGLLLDRHADARTGQNIFGGESVPPESITEIVKM